MKEKEFIDTELDLIGRNDNEWTQAIRRGFALGLLLSAYHQTGVFEALKPGPSKSAEEIAEKCSIKDVRSLEGGLNFMVYSDTSIAKDDSGKYYLTETGKRRIFADPTVLMALGAIGAYHPILTHLVKSLKGEETYGKDFARDGALIARSSFLTGKSNYEWVVKRLRELGAETVVDLGCGSADMLIHFCRLDEKLKGVGVDIDPGAVLEAGENAKNHGLGNRIEIIEGDMTLPKSYSDKLHQKYEKLAFNAIMSLHEFLIYGEDSVVNILKKMKQEFPRSYLFLGEFNKMGDKEIKNMTLADRMHKLYYQEIIHAMTPQGLADKSSWQRMFNSADVKVVEIKDDFPFRLVEYVLQF